MNGQLSLLDIMPEESKTEQLEDLMSENEYMELVNGRWVKVSTKLNTSEKPTNPIKTRLSDILEQNVDSRYHLSEKACRGILRRAGERGKELPDVLKHALLSTAGVVDISPTAFSKKAHPQVKGGTQGWEKSDTAHTLNLFNIGETRADELIVEKERKN